MAADWVTKTAKAVASELVGTETIRAALLLRSTGPALLTTPGSSAALPPLSSGRCVAGLTEKRLLMWSHSLVTGRPTDLKAEALVDLVSSIGWERRRTHHRLIVALTDGSSRPYVVRHGGGDCEAFVAAFGAVARR